MKFKVKKYIFEKIKYQFELVTYMQIIKNCYCQEQEKICQFNFLIASKIFASILKEKVMTE